MSFSCTLLTRDLSSQGERPFFLIYPFIITSERYLDQTSVYRQMVIGSLNVNVSGESVAHGKPAPDVFLQAAAALGVEPARCLVIEDAVAGVEAAHAGGMRCIAVAGERDLPGLRQADLMVKDLTGVTVERIRRL
jgi:beta-phosphoglucomutase-like phosphatase (HAD superfamily)